MEEESLECLFLLFPLPVFLFVNFHSWIWPLKIFLAFCRSIFATRFSIPNLSSRVFGWMPLIFSRMNLSIFFIHRVTANRAGCISWILIFLATVNNPCLFFSWWSILVTLGGSSRGNYFRDSPDSPRMHFVALQVFQNCSQLGQPPKLYRKRLRKAHSIALQAFQTLLLLLAQATPYFDLIGEFFLFPLNFLFSLPKALRANPFENPMSQESCQAKFNYYIFLISLG